MPDLRSELIGRIKAQGPLSIATFFTECLLHPKFGYYTTRDPFGAQGDFTTAPEISQIFGEILGLFLAQTWRDQGSVAAFNLVELGPGRGTLMADILRATRTVAGFHSALQLHLVEASPTLQAQQAKTLGAFKPIWHTTLDSIPHSPLFLVANEFFDALPVRQFVRDGNQWRERCITVIEDTLAYGLTDATPHAALAYRLADTKQGDLVETRAPAQAIAQEIGHRITQNGGMALIIDYGKWRSLGDTLQSLKSHQSVAPLLHPGSADLTAHVDFEALAKDTPSAHTRPTDQGMFLERLGVSQRANQLAKSMHGSALTSHIAAHRRLTHPSEMGKLFKVMGFFPANAPPPPGLDI